jgi:hypothetical protein
LCRAFGSCDRLRSTILDIQPSRHTPSYQTTHSRWQRRDSEDLTIMLNMRLRVLRGFADLLTAGSSRTQSESTWLC